MEYMKKDFMNMINDTKKLVQMQLENENSRPFYMSKPQLKSIMKELDKMLEVEEWHKFSPYYPKGITDNWDMQDTLGLKLLEVLEIYRKLFN